MTLLKDKTSHNKKNNLNEKVWQNRRMKSNVNKKEQ